MKTSIIITLFFICSHLYGFGQNFTKEQTKLLYKYNIQRHTTTCDDYVDSVLISIKSLPQSDRIEIQYLRYDDNVNSLNAVVHKPNVITEIYDLKWNLLEETTQFVFDSIPSQRSEYVYNEKNQVIQKKLFTTYFSDPKYVHKDSLYGNYKFSVNERYFYEDTLLTKYTFRSESDSVIYEYYYDDNNRLDYQIKTDKELTVDTVFFYYTSDTTTSIIYDAIGKETYYHQTVKDKNGRVIDWYYRQKRIPMKKSEADYGHRYYFDERGFIIRNETYRKGEDEVIQTCEFSFEN